MQSNLKLTLDAVTCPSCSGFSPWTLSITLKSRWDGSVIVFYSWERKVQREWVTSGKSLRSHYKVNFELCLRFLNPMLFSYPLQMLQQPFGFFLGRWIACMCQNFIIAFVFPFLPFLAIGDFYFTHLSLWFHLQSVLMRLIFSGTVRGQPRKASRAAVWAFYLALIRCMQTLQILFF